MQNWSARTENYEVHIEVSNAGVRTVTSPVPPPKKRFGQHFLVSAFHARRIAEAVPASGNDSVLEIGAGRGALTKYLLQRFPRLHVMEMDRDLAPILRDALGEGEWTLHQENALAFDLRSVPAPLHVVGNLPYNVAAPVIKKMLLAESGIRTCTFMLQREVAERIAAAPGSRRNGFLSVFCQFFGRPRVLFHVPRGAFFPKPKVESSVVQIVLDRERAETLGRERLDAFFAFVDSGYSMRRKMLVNTLGKEKGAKERIARFLERMGLSARVRPEELDVSQWLVLFDLVHAP
ncbi:MAG: ribosomal RNA small subunit methyltransferase A [Chitinivibrionales bacterium]|nr:ribosomal RNA small subunit methyltransferase A [Chitinivibrionales bacterium]MBD3394846.1 ribosomal RNA small subunit methyltransferase A [Chitinivibrionales bacterium]